MTNRIKNLQSSIIVLPIPQAERKIADRFASDQVDAEKAEQVRLNTLSVIALDKYLQMLDYDTDPTTGDLWNRTIRLIDDVADLEVRGLGRLECRCFKPGETRCSLPLEVQSNRIAYIGVEIDAAKREAKLLGFHSALNLSQPLNELQRASLRSLDGLVDYLNGLESTRIVQLKQWLEKIDQDWGVPEQLLGSSRRSRRSQNPGSTTEQAEAAKQINLGQYLLVLVVDVKRHDAQLFGSPGETTESWDICLQVYLLDEQNCLPTNLQISIIDDVTGETVMQDQSSGMERILQLDCACNSGDRFSVKLSLEDAVFSQFFAL